MKKMKKIGKWLHGWLRLLVLEGKLNFPL
jgi:hypothetical protein